MLHFTPIDRAAPGSLAILLRQSYAPLLGSGVSIWHQEADGWEQFDRAAYTNSQVGRCVFLTWSDEALVGFASFDPRRAPETALIGHHCVTAAFRQQGIGRMQFHELLRRIDQLRVAEIHATTLSLPFFEAARHLYISCGFAVVERSPWPHDPTVDRIEFVKRFNQSSRA